MSGIVVEDKREAFVLFFIEKLKSIKKSADADYKSEIKADEVIHWGNDVVPDVDGAQRIFLKDTDVDFIPEKENHEQELILEINLAIRRSTKELAWRDLVRLIRDIFLMIGKNRIEFANDPYGVLFEAETVLDFNIGDEQKTKSGNAAIIIRANYINAKWNYIIQ